MMPMDVQGRYMIPPFTSEWRGALWIWKQAGKSRQFPPMPQGGAALTPIDNHAITNSAPHSARDNGNTDRHRVAAVAGRAGGAARTTALDHQAQSSPSSSRRGTRPGA
jgi:hypothetical protein